MAYNMQNALVNLNEAIRKGGGGGDLPAVKLEVSQLKVDVSQLKVSMATIKSSVVNVNDQIAAIRGILASLSEYTETETKVGKYLGDDLYRCTWVFETPITAAVNAWTSTTIPKQGISQIVKAESVDAVGTCNYIMCSIDDSSYNVVRVYGVRASGTLGIKKLTLWYTKTSNQKKEVNKNV